MGSSRETPRDLGMVFTETGAEPEYSAAVTKYEIVRPGTIRVKVYGFPHGHEYRLLYTVLITAKDIIPMAREAQVVGSEGWNLAQWQDEGDQTTGH
jgi:hypothetical protein